MRVFLIVLFVLLGVPAGALAHGDASSHYLETSSFYPGFGARASQATELKVMGLLDAAQRDGYPIKLAILGNETDVSDTPAMLRHPQRYADFLAVELRRARVPFSAPVIVISPFGTGVAGPGAGSLDLPTGTDGEQLAQAAMAAIRQVSSAGGHTLPANVPPAQVPVVKPAASTSGSGYDLRGMTPFLVFIAIFGSALLYVQIRTRMARRHSLRGA